MTIRPYQLSDKQACLDIFQSNCPKAFDPKEQDLFANWLNHQAIKKATYASSAGDYYYVIVKDEKIVGCGGFFLLKNELVAQLAWGMIHSDYHNQGLGTALFRFRSEKIREINPANAITLGTSQHSYSFFEKMGFEVTTIIAKGWGEELHRYDMVEKGKQTKMN